MPDRLAPKPGQQQQAAQPQYPHPPLATLFAARSHSPAVGGKASSSHEALASAGSSGLLSPPKASADRMARAGSTGSVGSSGAGLLNKQLLSPVQSQPRQVRSSDPTDRMLSGAERFAGSPSPRTAAGMDATRSGSTGRGAGGPAAGAATGATAASPVAPAASVGGLMGPSGTPRVRTAEEIRQAYGRSQLNKAQVRACVGVGGAAPAPLQQPWRVVWRASGAVWAQLVESGSCQEQFSEACALLQSGRHQHTGYQNSPHLVHPVC